MSSAGPRAPGSPAGDPLLREVDQRYWRRHASKADLEYLNSWSLARDVRILAATLKVMPHPNAF